MSKHLVQNTTEAFTQRFGSAHEFVVRSPGRVNLIGEHTDYNDGFVMPMAINRHVVMAARPTGNSTLKLHSLDFNDALEIDISHFSKGHFGWREYVKGVIRGFQKSGFDIQGMEAVMCGDIPIGAGLSSSAALELAVAVATCHVSDISLDSKTMARLCRDAENDWVGVQCGIMDQLICSAGVCGHAMLMDCRSLQLTPVPLPEKTTVMILDTTTRRQLKDSSYQERRNQCREASAAMGYDSLRDVSLETFSRISSILPPILKMRARHVVSENQRVLDAAQAMAQGKADELGRLMNRSHRSLQEDYEVSGKALDMIVEAARNSPGCLGARMTGAGFSGCAVALINAERREEFTQSLTRKYKERSAMDADIYACSPQDGAMVMRDYKKEYSLEDLKQT